MRRSKIFLYCCFVFIIGVGISSFLPLIIIGETFYWFCPLLFFIIILAIPWKNKKIKFVALMGVFLFLGFWRYSISVPGSYPNIISYHNGKTVTFSGKVINEPDTRETNMKLEIGVNNILNNEKIYSVSGRVLVTTNLYPQYKYGDNLEIKCKLQSPEKFDSFSYDRFLSRYNIYSICYYPEIAKTNTESGKKLYKFIFSFKMKMEEMINMGLKEPQASLVRAIILGDKKGIPATLRENFSQSGISHVVAISGMHIGIIAVMTMYFLLAVGISRKNSFYFSTFLLFLYIILIGLPASAMRAGLMGFLVIWALNIGRISRITNSIFFAAFFLLLINPKLLRDDIGFQLSFLAIVGIVYCYPILEKFRNNYNFFKFKALTDIMFVTLSAQIFTLPLIAYYFSEISLLSPLTNLLVIWSLPFLIFMTVLALVLGLIADKLLILFFLPSYFFSDYIIRISNFISSLPYCYIKIKPFSFFWLMPIYLLLAFIILLNVKENVEKKV